MKKRYFIISLTLLVLARHVSYSQSLTKKYSPKEAKEDYTKFCTILETVHTGLFDYISSTEWKKLKDSTLLIISQPITEREFSKLLSYQVARIRNTHTRIGVTDSWIKKKTNAFPFSVKYIKDRLYIKESLTDVAKLPRGTEVLRINGKSPLEIKSTIWPYISTDGYIESYKRATLSEFFSWFYALFIDEPEQFNIEYKTPDGVTSSGTFRAQHESFRKITNAWKAANRDNVIPMALEIDKNLSAAYLSIHHSEAILDSLPLYFKRIKNENVKTLVIDLRGMWGLVDELHSATLYSYLVSEPFRFYERMEVMSNDFKLFDKDFTYEPYANSLEEIKREYFDKLRDSGKGYYLWENEPFMGIINPANIYFNGKIYILTDGLNYSASTDFTSKASTLENVFIVGEETGGEYRSYVSGAMFGLVLPNSKFGVKIATWKSVLTVDEVPGQRGRGVLPDFPVDQSVDDLVKNRDTVKEFVYNRIKQENRVIK